MIVRRRSRALVAAFGVAVALLGLVAALSLAQGQPSPGTYRIGILTIESTDLLRQRLRDLGYMEGRNVIFEIRATEGNPKRVNELALELARLNADVIVATHPAAVLAAKRATAVIPIVMVHTPDPVQLGFVTSLARPGGNITGVTSLSVDLSLKQIELLREAVPRASRIAVLWNPDNPWHPLVIQDLPAKTRPLGVKLQILGVRNPGEFENAFRAMVREGAGAVLVLADPMTVAHRGRLADLAARHRLPLMGGPRAYADAGGLMSYWADENELYGRAASYVDKILKGANPATLPVEQPTRYNLVVNLRTARALALSIPPSLLLRATVIE